jgi:uncharacterized protein DUF5317
VIIFLVAAIVAGATAVARGGSLKALADTKFAWVALLFVGLGIQLGAQIWAPSWLDGAAGTALLVGTNLLVVVFLFMNRALPGIYLIAGGLALNVLVITLNGAMPVSLEAARSAGMEPPPPGRADVEHERLNDDTTLPWLADVIAVPRVPQVFSVGDVVLGLGVAQLVYRQATSNKRRRRAATGTAASD